LELYEYISIYTHILDCWRGIYATFSNIYCIYATSAYADVAVIGSTWVDPIDTVINIVYIYAIVLTLSLLILNIMHADVAYAKSACF
jgi:hypothetical protein